ncbi:MAG: hypothetical protein RLZZ330_80 [Actinomycetota bacterium]
MAYEPGEIYFVRETAKELELGRTPFVKVGLVKEKDGRDSFGRLTEHQTGNPRTLFINKEDIVKTDAVTRIEALLHRIYANKRINGEWFNLETEEEIQEVIAKAKELSEEIKPLIKKFDEAASLEVVPSNGSIRHASELEIDKGKSLAVAKLKLKLCKEQKSEISKLLTVVFREGGSVSAAASTQLKHFEDIFDEEKFKLENLELWQSYQGDESKWQHSFLVKDKSAKFEDLDEEFKTEITYIKDTLESAKETRDLSSINEISLKLANLEGISKWDEDILITELKIATGEFDGIEGVCTWKRIMKISQKLNTGLLAAEQNDIYKKYLVTPDPKEYVITKKKKVSNP